MKTLNIYLSTYYRPCYDNNICHEYLFCSYTNIITLKNKFQFAPLKYHIYIYIYTGIYCFNFVRDSIYVCC